MFLWLSVRQCCWLIAGIVMLLGVFRTFRMIDDMQWMMTQMRQELKEEREKRKELEEIRLKDIQLQAAVQHCIGHQEGESNSFTGIRLLWGIFEIGYGNKQQMKSCITEYNDRLSRKMYLN